MKRLSTTPAVALVAVGCVVLAGAREARADIILSAPVIAERRGLPDNGLRCGRFRVAGTSLR